MLKQSKTIGHLQNHQCLCTFDNVHVGHFVHLCSPECPTHFGHDVLHVFRVYQEMSIQRRFDDVPAS
jgi:hypothetical protein